MRKILFLVLVSLFALSVNAQVPDINSLSTAQKMAYLKSLSASDKKLILEELQKDSGQSSQPLEQVQVVVPAKSQQDSETITTKESESESKVLLATAIKECQFAYQDHLKEKAILFKVKKGIDDDEKDEASKEEQKTKEKVKYIDDCLTIFKNKTLTKQASLKPFGYDLFSGSPTTFAPATEIPIPQNYVIGPGDTLKVFTYGNESESRDYVVNRDGVISLNKIGPMVVAGMTFTEVKQAINDRYSTQMIGVKTSVTMGELRSVRIFILGEANRSGSYTVSS